MDHENVLHLCEHSNWRKIFDRIEMQFRAGKGYVGAMCPSRGRAEGISVGWRLRDQLHANIPTPSSPILDDEGLSPFLIELLANNSGNRVDRTTCLKRNHYANRPVR